VGVPVTFIKDPGNQTESYLDSAVRNWRDTACLWRGSARDLAGTVNGRATPGWSSGQLWSVSASQWEQNSGGNLAAYNDMVNQRNTWITNANTAYTSGTWGSGTHWATVAGGDPNIQTTKYNEGYAAGAASKTTTAASSTGWNSGAGNSLSGSPTVDLISLTTPRAGLAHVSCVAQAGQNGGDAFAQLHLYVNGALILSGPNLGVAASSQPQYAVLQHQFNCSASQSVTIRATGTSTAHLNNGGTLLLTVGSV